MTAATPDSTAAAAAAAKAPAATPAATSPVPVRVEELAGVIAVLAAVVRRTDARPPPSPLAPLDAWRRGRERAIALHPRRGD